MHYFKQLKIEQSKKLLREENLSVSRICEMLGYSGIHNFTRSFKSATGFTPTGYRKSVLLILSE
jgi:YesN/AraC family two-component response regulator